VNERGRGERNVGREFRENERREFGRGAGNERNRGERAVGRDFRGRELRENGRREFGRREIGRHGRPFVSEEAARRGRFASVFAAQRQFHGRDRHSYFPARHAWRNGWRAAFVPWYGPVFWPYAYTDIFDYAFWPYGYEPGYWAYAYDDFIDGVFWGVAGPPAEYVVNGERKVARVVEQPAYSSVRELCAQPGEGVTAWPIAEIEAKLNLTPEQEQLLDDMREAAKHAAAVFKASCPAVNAFALTPTGRLMAMRARLQATLEAVQTVRPALDHFYASLTDEQKERFNEIGPQQQPNAEARIEPTQIGDACKEQKPGLSNLPIERIEEVVRPTQNQEDELDQLQEATQKAVSILQAACPEEVALTPPGRLQEMEIRLQAMIDAADTVKPALDSFYASLTNEQKARFNRMGRELAASNE
jgi:hypothetical protein